MEQTLNYLRETPSQTAGPYVHIGLAPGAAGFDIYKNELDRDIAGPNAKGERIRVEGVVVDGTGSPIKDVLLEVWQANAEGIYPHPEDGRAVEDGFRGFGRVITDFETGEWGFDTIKPGACRARDGKKAAPHLNLWLVSRGINIGLSTRMYFDDETESNKADPVLNLIEWENRRATLLAKRSERDGQFVYRFDIKLQGDDETVFFDEQSSSTNGNIIQWIWDFGDGSNPIVINYPNNADTSYLYANGGQYIVSLTTITSLGCPDTSFQQITIIPPIDKDFTISPNDSICSGDSFTFTQTGSAVLNTWLWNFGDGNTSTDTNPTHIYASSGVYDVSFFYTDNTGCSDSVVQQANIYDIPNASFAVNMDNACINSSVGFSGSSTSNIVNWDWDFGDGTTGSGQNIDHFYTSWGNILITLTVTDINGCSETVDNSIYLIQAPTPNFTYHVIVCDSLQFEDLSTSADGYNIVTWDWDFGDGVGTSDLQNPTYKFGSNTTPGGEVYNVSLTVQADSVGFICTETIVLPVRVPSLPDIFFTYMPEPTCLGDTTFFYGESGFMIDYWHWNFGDGNFSNDEYASHLYADTGNYNVELTIVDTNGCINSLTRVIRVNLIPEVDFTMSDSILCSENDIQFTTIASANVVEWEWDFGDGSISGDPNPNHYYNVPGTYTVTLTVTDDTGCSSTIEKQVIILEKPLADYSYMLVDCSSLAFQDLSTPPPGYNLVEWYWDFDDGTTSDLQNPVHSFPSGGVYDVMLVVTSEENGNSCSDSITQTILVAGLPSVFYTWNPEPTMLGGQTDFYGTSGSTITDWYWDFGDGNFAITQDASHIYATVGVYDVELTVIDIDGCTNSIIQQVTVVNIPELDFSWDISCVGDQVQFTVENPPTDIPAVVSWDWDFGDGGSSTMMDPIHVYMNANTYDVSLTIVDTMGASNTLIKQITVTPLPNSAFSVETPTCENNPVQFHDHSSTPTGYITQWHWDFGDGTTQTVLFPNDPDVSYTYATTGNYIVTLTVTNSDSCTNTSDNPVTIISSPIAMFSFSEGCLSNPIIFTDLSQDNSAGPIISWNWNFDDPASGSTNTSDLQNPLHIFSAAGDYDVTLSILNSNGCGSDTVLTVTVADDPEIDFTFTEACLGTEIEFESVTSADVSTYEWNFGDGGSSNEPNPTYIYGSVGDYMVTLTIVTTEGCMATVSYEVTVRPLPMPNFNHTGPTCLNEEVEFTDLSSSPNGLIEIWEWDFGDGNTVTINAPANPDVTHLYANEGTYDVILKVTDSDGCENEVIKQLQVVSSPIADYSYDETCYNEPVYFTDLSTANGGSDIQSWEWFFGDAASGVNNNSSLQNPTHIFSAPGPYTVTLIINNTMGCSDTTEQDITVDELPSATIGVVDDSICLGTLAEFSGIGTNISSWYWEFGDGGTSIEQNPSYMYMLSGDYTVTLLVTEAGTEQCTYTTDTTISVSDSPEASFEYQNTCLGDSTYFTDLSFSQYGFITTWEWDFGDGDTSTDEDPSHLYSDNNDYQVTLIVTDNYGCSNTITQWIQIFDSPIPAFSWYQECDPLGQTHFFDESLMGEDNSPIESWNWHINEGYYSSEIDPSYIYNILDTCYTVVLEITDGNGCISRDTNTQVCLFGEFEIDFTSSVSCLNEPTLFTASYLPENDSIASYSWNFNDGTPDEVTYYDTILHTFANPGLYIVTLTAVDTNDCTTTIYREVTVDSLPTAQFTNTIGSCSMPTEFTDISLGGGEFIEFWSWDFGDLASGVDNTSTLQNPTHIYGPVDSTYQVKLVVTNFNGCKDSVIQDVYVEPCILADFTLPEGPNCARNEVCFTDNSALSSNNTLIDQWRWDFGDGTTYNYGTQQNPVCHTYDNGADYDVQLIITATISGITYQDTVIQTLTINPTPEPEILVDNNCYNDSTRYYDGTITNGAPITNWFWNFGDLSTLADTAIVQNPVYQYPAYNNYVTSLLVSNEYGCTDSITDTVTIYKLPVAEFSFQEQCMSYYTYFEDESVGDSSDIMQWYWDFGVDYLLSDTSLDQSPVYIYDSIGVYTPELIVIDDNSCTDTIDHEIEIWPIPTSDFTILDTNQQGQIYLQNQSLEAVDYYWDFDFDYGVSSTEVDPIHQYELDGNYNIMLVSYNSYNCPDTVYQIYDLLFTNLFVPNAFVPSSPITDLQSFKPTGINLQSYRLEVYSAWGNLVFETTELDDGSPAKGWDGMYEDKAMPTGSYIWRISAVFEDGSHWKGTDNGDGNSATSGSVTLIR